MKIDKYHIYNKDDEFVYILEVGLDEDDRPIEYTMKPSTSDTWNVPKDFVLLRLVNVGNGFQIVQDYRDDKKLKKNEAPFSFFEYMRIILTVDARLDKEWEFKVVKQDNFMTI